MLDRDTLTARCAEIVRAVVKRDRLPTAHEHLTDYGADSIDRVDIVCDVEEKFDVSISDDESDALQTLDDLVRLVEAKTTAVAA